MPVPQAYCTDDVSSLFNSLNTPYRCGTNTVEDGIEKYIFNPVQNGLDFVQNPSIM